MQSWPYARHLFSSRKDGGCNNNVPIPSVASDDWAREILFVLAVFSVFLKEIKKLNLEDASQDSIVTAPNYSSELENTSSANGR